MKKITLDYAGRQHKKILKSLSATRVKTKGTRAPYKLFSHKNSPNFTSTSPLASKTTTKLLPACVHQTPQATMPLEIITLSAEGTLLSLTFVSTAIKIR